MISAHKINFSGVLKYVSSSNPLVVPHLHKFLNTLGIGEQTNWGANNQRIEQMKLSFCFATWSHLPLWCTFLNLPYVHIIADVFLSLHSEKFLTSQSKGIVLHVDAESIWAFMFLVLLPLSKATFAQNFFAFTLFLTLFLFLLLSTANNSSSDSSSVWLEFCWCTLLLFILVQTFAKCPNISHLLHILRIAGQNCLGCLWWLPHQKHDLAIVCCAVSKFSRPRSPYVDCLRWLLK